MADRPIADRWTLHPEWRDGEGGRVMVWVITAPWAHGTTMTYTEKARAQAMLEILNGPAGPSTGP